MLWKSVAANPFRSGEHLKEHGDKCRLNEEQQASPLDGAHSSPRSFTKMGRRNAQSTDQDWSALGEAAISKGDTSTATRFPFSTR